MSENQSKIQVFLTRIKNFAKTKWGIAIIVLGLIFLGYTVFHNKASPYTFVAVKTGSITESVSVTGNTSPIHSVALGFQNSGTIAAVYAAVGQTVYAGQALASLNVNDLSAQLRQAQASVDAQKAKLESIKIGAQPADIASSEASVAKAKQDLVNMYASIPDISNDSYAKGSDAVRTQIDTLFSNSENNSIQLTYNTNNSQAAIDAKSQRLAAATTLNAWQKEILSVNSLSSVSDLDRVLQDGLANLATFRQLLVSISATLDGATSMSASTLAASKTSVAVAMSEVNTASKNLNTIAQSIASQKLTVTQAEALRDLKKSGATAQDISAQQAQVNQAEAGVQSILAKMGNSRIVAPIAGVITQFDAKVGQNATPGITVISIISSNQFEIDAQVPETDIGKIGVGNTVNMTFDAFPGEIFTGKIFYIDPAQTINQGVVDYKIKISFDKPNPKMKSGLTANLMIETETHVSVLILPQYAVLQNDHGTFVKKIVGGVATTTPVTVGIQDQNGNVEILSGVTSGEQVLNIGLKQ